MEHMMQGLYLTLEKTKGGMNIRLTDEGREELEYQKVNHPDWTDSSMFAHLFEDFAGNGWMIVPAEDIGALTSCEIIISPDATVNDFGEVESVTEVYWHERYQIESLTEALASDTAFLMDGSLCTD